MSGLQHPSQTLSHNSPPHSETAGSSQTKMHIFQYWMSKIGGNAPDPIVDMSYSAPPQIPPYDQHSETTDSGCDKNKQMLILHVKCCLELCPQTPIVDLQRPSKPICHNTPHSETAGFTSDYRMHIFRRKILKIVIE